MPARELYDLGPIEVALVDKGANKRPILVQKRETGDNSTDTPETRMAEQITKVEFTDEEAAAVEAVMTMLGGGDAAGDEAMALAAKVLGKAKEIGGLYPKPEEIENAEHVDEEELEMAKRDLPEDVKKALQEGEAKIVLLQKQVQAETDKRLVTEHIQKARDWTNLGKPETVGPILKGIHDEVTAEQWTFLEERFSAAEEVLKTSGIFDEFGGNGGEGGEEDAGGKLNTIAKRLHDEGKATTFAKAYTMAATQNPDLVTEINNSTSTRGH